MSAVRLDAQGNALDNWYYADAGHERRGPVTLVELAGLRDSRALNAESLVWTEGMAEWQPLRTIDGFVGDAQAARDIVYAGFWKRVAASVIDSVIVSIAGAIVGGVLGAALAVGANSSFADPEGIGFQLVVQLVGLAVGAAYYAAFHASRAQATPGKQAVGIKVCRGDGARISLLRAIGRYFATILSALTLMVGFAMAGFTQRKQALHDMVCDTLVVDRYAYTGTPELQRPQLGAVTITVLVLAGLLSLVSVAAIVVALAMAGGRG